MGEVFAGRYELLDVIGEGGMGSVWRVWDRREERVVAAKVLRQSDAVSLLRFVREQAVRVRHPHVLTPLGWAGEDDRVLFTMPVVDGGSVASLVGDHGPLPPLLVAELLRQLLSALGSVHRAGIVHRDVKPANLLLLATGRERPHLLLTDFGIAVDESVPRFTRTGGVTGTPGYIAPESEDDEVTPLVDVYAAGQVGRAMLTALRPADARSAERPAGCPAQLWSAIEAMSAADPAARPGSAEAAALLLAGSGLTWTPGAMGDVEVLRHVEADPGGRWQLGVTPLDDLPTRASVAAAPVTIPPPSDGADGVVAPAAPPSPGGRGRRSRVLLLGATLGVLAVLVGGVVRATGGLDEPSGPTPERSPVGRSSTGPTPTATPSASTPPSPTASPSPSTGTVEVGPVVVRAGQPCGFADVGLRETTLDGVRVVCARADDGRYLWERLSG
ncbi:serine/threonine protein kinase [Phycicoccus sp. MAQZ13P-2]|uniref:serine/threonine-protein kinase n=1 Tax=Phycicoccus mangrovi TaxID=2840470 RepID=UPI001C005284|nr:serine/threonine-protein kinase [Phycicoccus mangrovi]MBT9257955.1 serine/threonine protein kinase [Phycicoccus mangrovi]MBT9276219.1 serine/threonine protein kinase [Phycicoccus mangrovi]